MSSFARAVTAGPVVLDGGLATHLEARGHDLSSHLWSARLLLEDPDEVVAAHRDYYAAGAQVVTSASYQASFDGLARLGLDRHEALAVLVASVRLADQARREVAEDTRVDAGRPRWVAASVGPYGAALGDGSEYRGDYGLSVAELRAWHRPRLEVLAEAGADVLALETIPCLAEVEALLAEVDGTGIPCWLSLTCDGTRTRMGEPLAAAFDMAADVAEVVAAGANCCRPGDLDEVVPLAVAVSGKPAVAYPNSGETFDDRAARWTGPVTFRADMAADWVANGVHVVGGCCRIGPDQVHDLAAAVTRRG